MRKRSIPFFVLALAVWVVFWRSIRVLTRTGFAYELGSVAWPIPMHIRLLGIAAELFFLTGLLFLTIDFVRWIKGRRT